jgi:endonuclease
MMWDLQEYAALLNDAIRRNEVIVLGCKCHVKYSGRAESALAEGDRVIIVKSDNSLLVHQPEGNAPINYMKRDASHSLIVKDGVLFMHSTGVSKKEYMDIKISRIHFFNAHKMEDGRSIVVTGTEKDMSDMIYRTPELVENGLKPVSREEQTKYGFIDVFCTDSDGNLVIIECKRYKADLGAVTQLRRYIEKMEATKGITGIRGYVAAPKITGNAKQMLEDWGYAFAKVNPPKYLERFDKKQSSLDMYS